MATVLVVEDDVDISSAICEALTEEGWQVVRASSAEEARGAVQSCRVDVVVSDVLLNDGSDGRILKADFARMGLAHVPFAFMTAAVREIPGFTDEHVLRKPFATQELLELLDNMLSGQEAGRASPGASGRPSKFSP